MRVGEEGGGIITYVVEGAKTVWSYAIVAGGGDVCVD